MFTFDTEVKRRTGEALIAATPVEDQSAVTSVSLTTVVVSASTPPNETVGMRLEPLKPDPVIVIV